MVGKSRMICQLPDQGVFLFLVCLRPEAFLGTPPRTPIIADLFSNMNGMSEYDAQSFSFQFMISCITHLSVWLKKLPVKKGRSNIDLARLWFNYQKTGDINCDSEVCSFSDGAALFWEEIGKHIRKSSLAAGTSEAALVGDLSQLKKDYSSKLQQELQILVGVLKKHSIHLSPEKVSLVYAFDEVRSLLNDSKPPAKTSFNIVRRTFCIVQKNGKCPGQFAILTDTTSNVANFFPIQPWDNSEYMMGESSFDPFVSIDSLDAFADHDPVVDLGSLELEYTKYGRPAFHAMTKASTEAEILDLTSDLLGILIPKILAAKHVDDITSEQAVAILSILVPLNINSSNQLASLLVASHMRFFCGISPDRKFVSTCQLPEAALARAALFLAIKFGLDNLINKVANQLGVGVSDKGYSGELTMQICCIAAYAKCEKLFDTIDMKDWARIKSVSLTNFLKALLSEEIYEKVLNALDDPKLLDEKVVRVGQFVIFNSDVDTSVLLESFKRGCGMVCHPTVSGCNIIIPVFCSSDPNEKLVEELMTCITIQIIVGGEFHSWIYHGMRPSLCGISELPKHLPYLSLYVSLSEFDGGSHVFDCSIIKSHNEVETHIAMSCMNYTSRQIFQTDLGTRIDKSIKHMLRPNRFIPERDRILMRKILGITFKPNTNSERLSISTNATETSSF
jgi:hypothetical protein